MDPIVKQEIMEPPPAPAPAMLINLSSSDSDSDEYSSKRFRYSDSGHGGGPMMQPKQEIFSGLPLGFLDPLPRQEPSLMLVPMEVAPITTLVATGTAAPQGSKQFWKAGDYEDPAVAVAASAQVSKSLGHVRVHPKFLHSNATSHKWALGALAELLDNSIDEVCNGATFVNMDMLENPKDGSRMLLVEDNGGGMDAAKLRQCMSLGYSVKSKMANTIGQYGNGFKTSTMRLGADVIVFTRSRGKGGNSPSQSIGFLSYTFLRNTGKEDIVVPMLDYEMVGQEWKMHSLTPLEDWYTNLETIVQWSPYQSEHDLLQQFNSLSDQGTRIVIYNLWEDDQGELELDFDANEHDIQLRGVNRDAKKIEMAKKFPNSRHFLTYQHSLRSYASILYLRLPDGFKMVLRGKEIEHHSIVSDMMMHEDITYRPSVPDGAPRDPSMVATLKIGFVKDATEHIDVQGYNVYHKNRLIKPFWRVWNAAGSDGRGVIGVLEANFIKPAHDKQGFERTNVLSRLEQRLVCFQKRYWKENAHKIGYCSRQSKKQRLAEERGGSTPDISQPSSRRPGEDAFPSNLSPASKPQPFGSVEKKGKDIGSPLPSVEMANNTGGHVFSSPDNRTKNARVGNKRLRSHEIMNASDGNEADFEYSPAVRIANGSGGSNASLAPSFYAPPYVEKNPNGENNAFDGRMGSENIASSSQSKVENVVGNGNGSLSDSESTINKLKDENIALKQRLMQLEEEMMQQLQHEKDKNKLLTDQLDKAQKMLEESNREQETLIDIFSEERGRRDKEEQNLRARLMELATTHQQLLDQLKPGMVTIKREPGCG